MTSPYTFKIVATLTTAVFVATQTPPCASLLSSFLMRMPWPWCVSCPRQPKAEVKILLICAPLTSHAPPPQKKKSPASLFLLQALLRTGTMLGTCPLRVLRSKTAIVPVNNEYLPRSHQVCDATGRKNVVPYLDFNFGCLDLDHSTCRMLSSSPICVCN